MSENYSHQVRFIEVTGDFEGQRIDNFLLRELKSVPKTRLYKLIRSGQVRVNKGRIKAGYKLVSGDIIRIPPIRVAPERSPDAIDPGLVEGLRARILYEDDAVVVLNKPSGLPVHAGSGLSYGVIDVMRAVFPESPHIELAHRLDKATSGCLVFAKKRQVLKELHAAFRQDIIKKEYIALTQGRWSTKEMRVNLPLKRYVTPSGERAVRVCHHEGKAATTWFESLQKLSDLELVVAKPVTGRTHQIRAHCKAMGHAIAGDDKYGDRERNRKLRELGLNRLFLHAKKITFPIGGVMKTVESPLDESLVAVLAALG